MIPDICSKSSQKPMRRLNKVDNTIAIITLDSTQNCIRKIILTQKQLSYTCKRCATLCCKLGGPVLTKKDVKQIEQAGYNIKDFLESTNNEDEPIY